MSRNTDIGLADLALAMDVLSPDAGDYLTRESIARILGFDWSPVIELTVSVHGPRQARQGRQQQPKDRSSQNRQTPKNIPLDRSRPIRARSVERQRESKQKETDISWLDSYGKQEVAQPAEHPSSPPPVPPLLRRNWQRGILQSATVLVEAIGQIDLDSLIRNVSERRTVSHLPRKPRPTLRHGVQVLVDTSRSMAPFYEDQEQLLSGLKKLFPGSRCDVWSFLESPMRGVVSDRNSEIIDYVPPDRKQVVLVVSDFGAAPIRAEPGPVENGEWLAFAGCLREADCPFVALSPYASEHWHPELRHHAQILLWDRTTTIAKVAHARRFVR